VLQIDEQRERKTTIRKEKKMFPRDILGLEEARAAVDAVLEEASKDPAQPISVVVVDDHGEVVCAARMDGAGPMFNYMAFKKARSSATTGKNTRSWAGFLGKRNYAVSDFVPEATGIPGGIAIVKPNGEGSGEVGPGQGVVYGAIAVSGRTGNEDEALSMLGLKALQKAVWG
jgi:uncharacterized protein GlcG (DUF336 family)